MEKARRNKIQLVPACYLVIVLLGVLLVFSQITVSQDRTAPRKDVIMEAIKKDREQTAAVEQILLQRQEMIVLAERFFPEVKAVYIQKDIQRKQEAMSRQADNSIDGSAAAMTKTLLGFDKMSFAARRELYHRSRNIAFLREQLEVCDIGFKDNASRLEMTKLLEQLEKKRQDENEEWQE